MFVNRTAYFLGLLVSIPFLTLGQKVSNSKLIDLTDKTFVLKEDGEIEKTENDLNLYLIFHKNGSATFRLKKGNTVTNGNPLNWRFIGDSLYVQNSPIEMTADGKTQTIDREPTRYAIEKTPNGYLLKERGSQAFWSELK